MGEKPTVIFIDDEERVVRALSIMCRAYYNVIATTSPNEALDALRKQRVHVLVSDQRMPDVTGVELLRQARAISPSTMRILLTGYSDLAAIVGSINDGEIFRFINKPWDPVEFKNTLDQAAAVAADVFAHADANASGAQVDLGKIGAVLVIDDSEEVYKNVQAVIGTRAKVHWATTLDDAFELLERMPVSVVVSDVQLGGVDITLALKSLKRVAPSVVTVVLAWFRDTKQLVDLINQAQVFRFLPKPIRPHMLETTIDSAMRRHCELRDSPILSRQHQVDQAAAPEATPVSSRIMAFFQRWGARK